MKNQVVLQNPQTSEKNIKSIINTISPFAVVALFAVVGLAFMATFGMKYWMAYVWFLPIASLTILEIKSVFEMDFNFEIDNDIMAEIYEDLQKN